MPQDPTDDDWPIPMMEDIDVTDTHQPLTGQEIVIVDEDGRDTPATIWAVEDGTVTIRVWTDGRHSDDYVDNELPEEQARENRAEGVWRSPQDWYGGLNWRDLADALHEEGGVPERRAEVVALAQRGRSISEISDELGIERSNVAQHKRLYREENLPQARWLVKNGPEI